MPRAAQPRRFPESAELRSNNAPSRSPCHRSGRLRRGMQGTPLFLVFSLALTLAAPLAARPAGLDGDPNQASQRRQAPSQLLATPSAFVPNRGQAGPEIAFLAQGTHLAVALSHVGEAWIYSPETHRPPVVLRLGGAAAASAITPSEPTTGRYNYFFGTDPEAWQRNLPSYGRLAFARVFTGIDLEYHFEGGALEFDFLVAAGASPEEIRFHLETPSTPQDPPSLRLLEDGSLGIHVADSELRLSPPLAFQLDASGDREEVPCHFTLTQQGEVGFAVASYDASRPLRIDPTLLASTYLGGSSADRVDDIHLDAAGNIYVAGQVFSDDFPVVGGVQGARAGSWDLYVAKLDPTAQTLIYSTYLGGTGVDWHPSLAVDAAGSAHLLAQSYSNDYPTIAPLQATNLGNGDLVVSKLTPLGDSLVYSTYLGGTGLDESLTYRVSEVGADGRFVVGGYTDSDDFPVVDAFQASRVATTCTLTNGNPYPCRDLVVSVLAADGSSLLYSTYYGGPQDDVAPHLALGSEGDIYLAFYTGDPDFPTVSAPQPIHAGGWDMYLAKLRPDGSPPLFATYWGGTSNEVVFDVEVDSRDRAHMVGWTTSADYPLIEPLATYQATNCGTEAAPFPCSDVAMVRFNARGTAADFSSPLGGTHHDSATSLRVDAVGNIALAGGTTSPDFPLVDPVQADHGSPDLFNDDVIAVALRGNARPTMLMSTFLGGEGLDFAFGLDVDARGVVTLGGNTDSDAFPVANALQAVHGGHGPQSIVSDGFIARISPDQATLALEQKVPAVLGEAIAVPLSISPGGYAISSLAFSIDLPDCLDFDPTDNNGDGLPDAFELDLPPGFAASVTFDPGDTDGEIDVVVLDPAPPLAALATSFLGGLKVTPICLPGGNEIELPFSASPALSFGTSTGASAPGFGIDGSLLVFGGSRGDCNGDGSIDAGDISACVLEVFDDDGTFWLDTGGGTFPGTSLGCDANADTVVDAGDLSCKQLLIFQGPGACDGGALGEGEPPRLQILGPAQATAGEPVTVIVELDNAGLDLRSMVLTLDLGPGMTLSPDDSDGDGLPDAVVPELPAGFTLAATPFPERRYAELAFAVLPPADLGAVLPSGPIFTLTLETQAPAPSSGLEPSRQPPLSFGDSLGRSLAGELTGLELPIRAPGWIFGDGFESGDTQAWTVTQ